MFSKQNTNAHVDAHMHRDALIHTVELLKDVLSACDAELNNGHRLPKIRGIMLQRECTMVMVKHSQEMSSLRLCCPLELQ